MPPPQPDLPSRAALERLIGAVIVPSLRPVGGLAPDAPARAPSPAYMQRFPPVLVIGFGRRLTDGVTIDGLSQAITELRGRAARPFRVACDLERGAGYHVPGLTALPPIRAIVEAQGPEAASPMASDQACALVEEAALRTGIEARGAGIDLILAPVLDVNSNPANPIIGARAFGTSPYVVANNARAFLRGLARAGVGASLKHFPGHGDTHVDSHLALPRVVRRWERKDAGPAPAFDDRWSEQLSTEVEAAAGRRGLEDVELLPYTEVLGSDEAAALGDAMTVMVGHLDVPDLTGAPGLATSLAPRAVAWLAEAGFPGTVLTDGLEMLAVVDEPDLGLRALRAGCHGLLGPRDEEALAADLLAAVEGGRLEVAVLRRAAAHMERLADALGRGPAAGPSFNDDSRGLAWAQDVVRRAFAAQPHVAAFAGLLGGLDPAPVRGHAELVARLGLHLPVRAVVGRGTLPRLILGSPRHEVVQDTPQRSAAPLVWFGPPETVPARLRDRPFLWAWAPDSVVERALAALLRGV